MDVQRYCSICGVISTKSCASCSIVYYCGVDHQRQHWKVHKKTCKTQTPITKEIWTEALGNHLIAFCDVEAGDRILTDIPLLVGPTGSFAEFAKLCLSCSKQVENVRTRYKCSNCKWPVCNLACQNGKNHKDNECSVFKANGVRPDNYRNSPEIYEDILLLRGLLLRDKDAEKWKSLMSLESHVEGRKGKESAVTKVQRQFSFIRDTCHLLDFDYDTVNYISGVLSINTFEPRCVGVLPLPENMRCESRIYSQLSKLTHECISNVKVVQASSDDKQDGCVTIIATIPIKKGQPLTQFYGGPEQGTLHRQMMQKMAYFFSCQCTRCMDPTELGTNYSSIKCPSKTCLTGYVLPVDPISPESPWKCNQINCQVIMTVKEVQDLVSKVAVDIEKLREEFCTRKSSFRQFPSKGLEFLNIMEMKLKALSETVHPNHFSTFVLKDCILEMLQSTEKPFGDTDIALSIGKKMLKYSQDCLSVYQVFFPGLTPEQGKYIFYICAARTLVLGTKAFKNPVRSELLKDAIECHETEKMGIQMLAGMPEGSEARSMFSFLQTATKTTQFMIQSLSPRH